MCPIKIKERRGYSLMKKWLQVLPKSTGLRPYVWLIFCILPFYFLFQTSSKLLIAIGFVMILLFFIAYRLAFSSTGWRVYFWFSVQILISIAMTNFFGYMYFSLFIASFIGNIKNKAGFYTSYIILIISTLLALNVGFFFQSEILLPQIPFIVISCIGVILLPFNTYNRKKRELLEEQLEDANKKIAELIKVEERQRIARDLHDTLGQKLSLIGLKSDLASKLVLIKPEQAKNEIKDIQQTARTALKEVREMVSEMRGTRVAEEMVRIKQILKAADIKLEFEGTDQFNNTPLLIENVLSMCLKEAVNNIVKHSQATICKITIKQLSTEWYIKIEDNGVGNQQKGGLFTGNGIQGMKERLEFVNGWLDIQSSNGVTLMIKIPNVIKQVEREDTL